MLTFLFGALGSKLQRWSASQDFEKGRERLVVKSLVPNPETELKSTKDNHLAVVLETNREYSEKWNFYSKNNFKILTCWLR